MPRQQRHENQRALKQQHTWLVCPPETAVGLLLVIVDYTLMPCPQALAPCLEELQRLRDAVEAEGPDSDGRKAAQQQLKLYMQVRASTLTS